MGFHRLLTAVSGALLLGGCGSALSLLPPGIPSGTQLESYANSDFAPAYRLGATPRETLIIGVAYVNQRCAEFFDAVEQMARRTEVLSSSLLTAGNQTLALMAVAERSALSIARVAAAFEITKVLLNEYKEQFIFAPHSVELRSIVLQAMLAQRQELVELLEQNALFSDVDAVAAIKKYAENCTLATIRDHWDRAMARAVQRGVQPENLAGPQAGALARGQAFDRRRGPANVLGLNRYVVR